MDQQHGGKLQSRNGYPPIARGDLALAAKPNFAGEPGWLARLILANSVANSVRVPRGSEFPFPLARPDRDLKASRPITAPSELPSCRPGALRFV